MAQLDQLAISRVLGSTFQQFSRSRFGGLAAVRPVGQMLAARPKPPVRLAPDNERDAKLIEAFEKAHQGFSVDRTFADPILTSKFIAIARSLGVDAPQAAICRRVLRMRKEGGFPVATTKEDKRNLSPYLIPAELAFAQLTYHYDASYDDLLSDPEIGSAFDELAFKVGRGAGELVDYRLAALHLRKNVRTRKPSIVKELAKIDVADLTSSWQDIGLLSVVPAADVPESEGILSILEPNRHLYLTRHKNLRMGVELFQDKDVLSAIANRFWKPSPNSITIQVLQRNDVKGSTLSAWELKSLELYRPIFNMPLAA